MLTLKRSLIAAGTLVVALLAFQPTADAGKLHVQFGFGAPYPVHGYGHKPYYGPKRHYGRGKS